MTPTDKNRHKESCTRTVTRGTLSFSADGVAHAVRFEGWISRHTRLTPGRFTLVITATNAMGQRATAKLTFTIVGG